jgi:hypothetical protein
MIIVARVRKGLKHNTSSRLKAKIVPAKAALLLFRGLRLSGKGRAGRIWGNCNNLRQDAAHGFPQAVATFRVNANRG